MTLRDPETARIMQAAEEATERLRAATAAYEATLTAELKRDMERAVRPVCPCCHRPMTDEGNPQEEPDG